MASFQCMLPEEEKETESIIIDRPPMLLYCANTFNNVDQIDLFSAG
jgi:hypothetical protein